MGPSKQGQRTATTKANLALSQQGASVDVHIPTDLAHFAERCKQAFLARGTSSSDGGSPAESAAELVIDFISHLGGQGSNGRSRTRLAEVLWQHLENRILENNDIHVYAAVKASSPARRRRLISRFYALQDSMSVSRQAYTTALLRARSAGNACIYAVFGGQGNTRDYFEELRAVKATYPSFVTDLIESCSHRLSKLAADARASDQFPLGLDVLQWLEEPEDTPSTDHLILAPLSFPLIGLLQLCHVMALIKSLGGSPSTFMATLNGVSGHSQGIVIATMLATVTTWEDFAEASLSSVTTLFWIGTRSQQVFRQTPLPEDKAASLETAGLGRPSPMLSVTNVILTDLQGAVDAVNSHLPPASHLVLALVNRQDAFVVSGPERTLAALIDRLDSLGPSQSQSRVAFSKRKMKPRMRFLPVSIPCHHHLLQNAVPIIEADLQRAGIEVRSQGLLLPVNQTNDGRHVAALCSENAEADNDVVPFLIRAVTTNPVDWREVAFPSATHIVDFGPGGVSGVGALTMDNLSGSGARVIVVGRTGLQIPNQPDMGSLVELYDRRDESLGWSVNWPKEFAPSLLRVGSGQTLHIGTRMASLLGLPPVMVAGMTPTTTHPSFVAAVMRAGYHAEFACGGYSTPTALRTAILALTELLPPGRGITLNVIYASPKTLAWQIPLIRRLRIVDRLPITGLTVGGGVPSIEVATEYITTLGIEHLSLKPGSVASIFQAIEVAQKNPSFPVILQWTGGRGGGHHSFEDFHAPILETYSRIRQCPNLILVAGSGFSDAEDAFPYLNGSWSLANGRATRMPFDGILLGSRVMACREAATSPAAKAAIAACPGLENSDWEGTYSPRGAGGIISITSEMGEPMHVVATRGALLWAELDRTLFSIPRGPKRMTKLESMRKEIIARLNADFQKPWFARRYRLKETDGPVACELDEMTYSDVVRRILELCCFGHEAPELKWIDPSYARLLSGFLVRTQERLLDAAGLSKCLSPDALHHACEVNPVAATMAVMGQLPAAAGTQLHLEDVHYLVAQCQARGMKPVPFVPALDANFETWFKKDSLWQSESLEAVVGQDAGRVLILQGPVATRGVRAVDEPVGQVLDGINDGMVKRLLAETYQDNRDAVLQVEYLPRWVLTSDLAHTAGGFDRSENNREKHDGSKIQGPLNGESLRLAISADAAQPWRQALLQARHIFRGAKLVENPLWTITESLWAEKVECSVDQDDGSTLIRVLGAPEIMTRSAVPERDAVLLEIRKPALSDKLTARLYTYVTKSSLGVPLDFRLEYHPETPYSLVREEHGSREQELYRMYRQLWLDGAKVEEEADGWFSQWVEADEERVRAFNKAVGYSKAYQTEKVNMDFAIVGSWAVICSALMQPPIRGDLLRLVHLSNGYQFASPVDRAGHIEFGDVIQARARQVRVEQVRAPDGTISGCEVEIVCHLSSAKGHPIMTMRSAFLIRGQPEAEVSDAGFFKYVTHPPQELVLSSAADVALFRSKMQACLIPSPGETTEQTLSTIIETYLMEAGSKPRTLEFHLETQSNHFIKTTGSLFVRSETGLVSVGDLESSVQAKVQGEAHCPVLGYLTKHGRKMNQSVPLERPLLFAPLVGAATIPYSNETYSRASGDYNPIHTSRQFAALAGNGGRTITHGMYCSAVVRQAVERHVAGGSPERILRYETKFVDMVLPGDVLDVNMTHVAMQDGCMVVDIQVSRQPRTTIDPVAEPDEGSVVITGSVLVSQPQTVFVFTGQGSQEVGMGMDLYQTSAAARAVWDEAEDYLQNSLGLSLLQIVRENPKSVRVHFGGTRGAVLREKYMAAKTSGERVFPTVDTHTPHYTHSAPAGLLFKTEFSQLAITTMQIAAFRDMRASGVIATNRTQFAGHSLGEFGALAAVTDALPIQTVLPMAMVRGLTMQKAVERDAMGRSAFGMVAVDPGRVLLKTEQGRVPLSHEQLGSVVVQIGEITGLLLEIVNHNVKNSQYVCAGELRSLKLLQEVLEDVGSTDSPSRLDELVQKHASALDAETTESFKRDVQLVRGRATIPLAGIDVPFHSSLMKPRMPAFRQVLLGSLNPQNVRSEQLVGKYIPNVTGEPFDISKEYFEKALAITGSERLRTIVQDWDQWMEKRGLEEQTRVKME
ncbi:hypothetical protein PspLS_11918 [Pyricularia sp. CBS 133598]|nr:hypothetical protein PspLS_11918 [Pyricularia sp. CBS 133598]